MLEETSDGVLPRAEVREAGDLAWMASLLAGLGCPLVVRRPPELRDALRTHAARLAEAVE